MKKVIFLAIAAAAALTACSKSEVVDSKFNEQISFETYLGRDAQTKGAIINTTNITGVKVYGYYTGNDPWTSETEANLWTDGLNLTFTEGQLNQPTKNDVRYWANDTDKYTFLAYAPYDNDNLTVSGTKNPTLTYSVDTDFTKHVDVLVANPRVEGDKNIDRTKGTVNLKMEHKLARLTVKTNVTGNGPFTFHIKNISLAGKFNTSGTLALADPKTWTAKSADATYVFASSTEKASTENALPATYDYATEDKGYMMMIPVDATTHNAVLTVAYTTFDATANMESRVYTQTYNVTNDFVMGKAYAIQLDFVNDATVINFNVIVDDWGSENEVEITPAA